ncbi:penicillin amidase [Faunimonas pinastri]|uniref:Penicillin amidase n=1 Tax=Faunimonas pinastri TaxID=1855383 RepID=A0A1H9AN38_9HYPH|nr:penicillin amidase [Faunimonas pinastri]
MPGLSGLSLSGIRVAAGLLGRALIAGAPPSRTLAERLAMLRTRGLPLQGPVRIHWNEHQVPFIEAETDDDLAVALGLVHAHLRIGQMEMMRRLATGRVAELVGPLGVELDRALRLFDFPRAVPEILASLPEETRRWAEGFVAGVNAQLLGAAELPPEFRLLDIPREPWTLHDLFAVAKLAGADVSWLSWPRLLKTRDALPPDEWGDVWRELLRAALFSQELTGVAGSTVGEALRSGSNSACVDGRRTGTGAAMIASDPHLSIALPGLFLIAGYRSPGHHAVGLMIPGLPFIGLGRNRSVAWGGTNLHAAASDLVDVSTLQPAAFGTRREVVKVRGAADVELSLRETRFGPVVTDGMILRSRAPAALRWIGHSPSDELTAMLRASQAETGPPSALPSRPMPRRG